MNRYRAYVESLDLEALYANSTLKSWVASFPIWLILVAVGAWIPVTARHIRLSPWPILAMVGTVFLAIVLMDVVHAKRGLGVEVASMVLVGSPLIDLTMAMMVSLSEGVVGKVLYGLLLLLSVLAHSWMYRVTPRQPYVGILLALLLPLSALGHPTVDNLILMGGISTGCVTLAFSIGIVADVQHRNQQRAAAERAAVAAQLLAQAHSETASWEQQFTQLAGLHHDIGNLLTTATLKSAVILRTLDTDEPLVPTAEVKQGFATIHDALKLVSGLIEETKRAAPVPELQRGDVTAVLKRLVEQLRPVAHASLSLDAPGAGTTAVPGGEATLERLFDNLLRNALEGDGTKRARNVRVDVVEGTGSLSITLQDDGPGFPEHLLAGRAKGYFTTKANGSGLGLVTAEALTAACRGVLRRTNLPGGGARVEVLLPRVKDVSKVA